MVKLTHIDEEGKARMVDISAKRKTNREAVASGVVRMSPQAYRIVRTGQGPKGDVFAAARIAGIMGAKRTHDLIPLCHPISLSFVGLEFAFDEDTSEITLTSTVRSSDRTGVEMEAMTCVMIAALTVYDMCKAIDKGIELGPFMLLKKSGGKSGTFTRPPEQEGTNSCKAK
jgi:cyclic pyranopterin phosphate synthase